MAAARSDFCNVCEQLYSRVTTPFEAYLDCSHCGQRHKMGPMDTLLYDESGKVNTATMQTILRSAGLDPTNPRAMRKCGKCGNDKVRQVRSLGEMRLINICEKCSKSWIDVPEKE